MLHVSELTSEGKKLASYQLYKSVVYARDSLLPLDTLNWILIYIYFSQRKCNRYTCLFCINYDCLA